MDGCRVGEGVLELDCTGVAMPGWVGQTGGLGWVGAWAEIVAWGQSSWWEGRTVPPKLQAAALRAERVPSSAHLSSLRDPGWIRSLLWPLSQVPVPDHCLGPGPVRALSVPSGAGHLEAAVVPRSVYPGSLARASLEFSSAGACGATGGRSSWGRWHLIALCGHRDGDRTQPWEHLPRRVLWALGHTRTGLL